MQPVDSKGNKKDSVNRQEYEELYHAISTQAPDDLARELSISEDKAELLLPTAMIYHNIFEETDAEFMWLSGITICDGMAADFAECKEHIVPAHPFSDDIISVSRKLAERFCCDTEHIHQVEIAALKLFDALRKANHLTKKDRLLLQIAAILHNCGSFLNLNDIGENSYKIVTSTEIIGLSHLEREIIANVVRYNIRDFDYDMMQLETEAGQDLAGVSDRTAITILIAKLTAILRLANSMDKTHKSKLIDCRMAVREGQLVITTGYKGDLALESASFEQKAAFFEEIFGIRPVLKQKRRV